MTDLVSIFQSLNKQNIKYCILRNWQFVRGSDPGSDVDIVIPKSDQKKATKVFENNGFYKSKRSGLTRSFYNGILDGKIITIDVAWDEPRYNGVPTVSRDRLMSQRRKINQCWVPSKEDYILHLVFHGVIKKGYHKQSYKNDISELSQSADQSYINQHASELFGKKGPQCMGFALNGTFESAQKMRRELVTAYFLNHPQSIPEIISFPIQQCSLPEILRQGIEELKPTSPPIISVTGPDGAGKSTLTENAIQEFESKGYDTELVKLGLTNDSTFLMKSAKYFYNNIYGYDVDAVMESESQGVKTLGTRDPFYKAIIHYLDISLRWLQARRSDADVVVADRYIHDVGIYDNAGPLKKTFPWFESDNVYLFLLTGDPGILENRSEYDQQSLEELVARYESLNFARIDANEDPRTVVDNFFNKVFTETDFLRYL